MHARPTQDLRPSFGDMPEELVERILFYALIPPFSSHSSSRLASLLVCRKFNRIGTPHLYRSLRIQTARSASLLARTLTSTPELASCVKHIYARASFAALGDVFRACAGKRLDLLDLTLDAGVDDDDVVLGKQFWECLGDVDVKSLVLRKRGAYLTQERPKVVMQCLAKAVLRWQNL
ncbi:hypothetical protein EW146_g9432, partial [Bondarzewia mesenterica]